MVASQLSVVGLWSGGLTAFLFGCIMLVEHHVAGIGVALQRQTWANAWWNQCSDCRMQVQLAASQPLHRHGCTFSTGRVTMTFCILWKAELTAVAPKHQGRKGSS